MRFHCGFMYIMINQTGQIVFNENIVSSNNFKNLYTVTHGRSQEFFSGGGNTFSKKFSKNIQKIFLKNSKKIPKKFKKFQKKFKTIQKKFWKIFLRNFLKCNIFMSARGIFCGGKWKPPGEGLKGGSPRGGFRGAEPPDAGEFFKKFVKNQWKS